LKAANVNLSEKVSRTEKSLRKNNIVVYGVQDNENESVAFEKIVKDILGLPAAPPAESINRLGNQKGRRPILVKLCSEKDKKVHHVEGERPEGHSFGDQ
jgi:hypothetical protein